MSKETLHMAADYSAYEDIEITGKILKVFSRGELIIDSQSGLESGIGITLAALSGINMCRGPGMMAFANCQSYEKLVIDNNICGMALRLVGGIECNEETIGLDVITAAGRIAERHLSSDHTSKWLRQELFFPSDAIHRRTVRQGQRSTTAWERAQAEVEARLSGYKPARLPEDQVREIKAIMRSYARSKGVDELPVVGGGWVG
jgi:trimethylamine--corrinoid protein Co-methyltransferase